MSVFSPKEVAALAVKEALDALERAVSRAEEAGLENVAQGLRHLVEEGIFNAVCLEEDAFLDVVFPELNED